MNYTSPQNVTLLRDRFPAVNWLSRHHKQVLMTGILIYKAQKFEGRHTQESRRWQGRNVENASTSQENVKADQ